MSVYWKYPSPDLYLVLVHGFHVLCALHMVIAPSIEPIEDQGVRYTQVYTIAPLFNTNQPKIITKAGSGVQVVGSLPIYFDKSKYADVQEILGPLISFTEILRFSLGLSKSRHFCITMAKNCSVSEMGKAVIPRHHIYQLWPSWQRAIAQLISSKVMWLYSGDIRSKGTQYYVEKRKSENKEYNFIIYTPMRLILKHHMLVCRVVMRYSRGPRDRSQSGITCEHEKKT